MKWIYYIFAFLHSLLYNRKQNRGTGNNLLLAIKGRYYDEHIILAELINWNNGEQYDVQVHNARWTPTIDNIEFMTQTRKYLQTEINTAGENDKIRFSPSKLYVGTQQNTKVRTLSVSVPTDKRHPYLQFLPTIRLIRLRWYFGWSFFYENLFIFTIIMIQKRRCKS